MTVNHAEARPDEARRALVLHDRPLVVDLIELTLNHGVFVVRAARDLAEAEAILGEWHPHMTIVDMDHDDSTALLGRLGASNTLTRSVTPVLGLTRRGDLRTKLRAFDLGVDDVLTMPFSPEELLARCIVITLALRESTVRSFRRSHWVKWSSTSSIARCAPVPQSFT
jgi:DNA-binding response OmpR family regulator